MKLQADRMDVQSITAYGEGWVAVNGERLYSSLALGTGGERIDWHCQRFEDLRPDHFDQLASLGKTAPELVVFGSGSKLRFPSPALQRGLVARGIGMETMDTPAACRTYNILAAEGRCVVLALLIEG